MFHVNTVFFVSFMILATFFLLPTFPGILNSIEKLYTLIIHTNFFIEFLHGRRLDAIVLILALTTMWCTEAEA
jgi:hypothetical protein